MNLSRVRKLALSWGIIWRMAVWGLGAGMALGSVYGLLVVTVDSGAFYVACVAIPTGAVAGGMGGLVLGLIEGLLMALVTLVAFYPVTRSRRYRVAMSAVCVVATVGLLAVASIGSGDLWDFILSGVPMSDAYLIYLLIPGAIAVAASVFVSSKAASWVIFESSEEIMARHESRLQSPPNLY